MRSGKGTLCPWEGPSISGTGVPARPASLPDALSALDAVSLRPGRGGPRGAIRAAGWGGVTCSRGLQADDCVVAVREGRVRWAGDAVVRGPCLAGYPICFLTGFGVGGLTCVWLVVVFTSGS